jgi:hypothetical protein
MKERGTDQEQQNLPIKKGSELATIDEIDLVNQVDDKAIVEMMTGQAIQEYVYSFKQGGRLVEGLTLAGINEAANRRGGIHVEDVNFEERENSWIVIVKAVDEFTGSSRYGACEQPKRMGGREDAFAFTKAVHKAQRNAIKQLIPVPIIKEVLNFYLHRGGQRVQSAQDQQDRPANDKISNAQKSAFASYHSLREKMEKEGIKQEVFWEYVKRRYAVESRNDMTERQWVELAAELKAAEDSQLLFTDMVKRVKKYIAADRMFNEDQGTPEVEENEARAPQQEKKPDPNQTQSRGEQQPQSTQDQPKAKETNPEKQEDTLFKI